MKPPLRLAVIGAGYFSQFHFEAWRRIPEIALVGVSDRDEGRARAVAGDNGDPPVFTGIEAMLDATRPDLVDIVAPPGAHLDIVRAVAARRIAAICQKPFCRDIAEAEQAVALAERAGSLLVVHENFRFQPWYGEIKRRIDDGELGQIYQLTFRLRPGDGRGPDAYLGRQPYFQTMPRFLVHETAIHWVDTFRALLGEVTSVYADLARLNPVIAGEDAGVILFTFASGARAIFDGNRLVDHAAENQRLTMGELWLEGAEGSVRLDGDGRLFRRRRGQRVETDVEYRWERRGFGGDCVYRLQRHVVDHILTGMPIVNAGRDYLVNLRIEEAIYESARLGRVVRL